MSEETRKAELAWLEQRWQEEHRKIKKYRLLLKGAQERLEEIEKKIQKL